MLRKVLIGLALLLVAIQFIRPQQNLAAGPGLNDINVRHPVPADVQLLLQHACYDCHSNHTTYPWYAKVQPVAWWLDYHIRDAKRELNFSEFGSYPAKRAARKAEAIADEVEHHSMPLRSYTWMHPEARLTPAEIKLITAWADKLGEQIDPP